MCTSLFFPKNVWKNKNKAKSKKAAFGECFAEWWRIFCANQVLDAVLMTWINLPWRPLEAQLKAFGLFALETNVCKQIKLMQRVLKWVAFLLLNFQNRNKPDRKWTQQARSSIFIEYEQPSHYQTGSCSSSHGHWQMTCVEKQINWFLKTASAFWQLRQQTVVTEAATGESSVLRLLCDSLY